MSALATAPDVASAVRLWDDLKSALAKFEVALERIVAARLGAARLRVIRRGVG